jgi:hypothetical protein
MGHRRISHGDAQSFGEKTLAVSLVFVEKGEKEGRRRGRDGEWFGRIRERLAWWLREEEERTTWGTMALTLPA